MIGLHTHKDVIVVPLGLNDENEPILEGHTIYRGKIPFEERVKRDAENLCVDCGEKSLHGVFHVGTTEFRLLGIRLFSRVNFTTFTCLKCLNHRNPIKYPLLDPWRLDSDTDQNPED